MIPNVNPKTGVHYGVANPNNLPGWWFDDFEPDYPEGMTEEETENYETYSYVCNKPDLQAQYDSNTNTLMVFFSLHVVKCRPCSPCYPNAGDLDNQTQGPGLPTYDFCDRTQLTEEDKLY